MLQKEELADKQRGENKGASCDNHGPEWTLTRVARIPKEEAVYPISVKCPFARKHIWIGFPMPQSSSHRRVEPSNNVYRKAQENCETQLASEHSAEMVA